MTRLDHQLIDLIEQLWGEQSDIVLERLKVVGHIFKSPMAKHLAQGSMFAHEFVQAVVVDVEVKADDTAHQNRPQGHARASVVLVNFGRYLVLQQFEDGVAQAHVGVNELQAFQNLGDVVA
jgi:hypothetical protein